MYPSPTEVSPGPWDPSSPSQATRRPVVCARDRHFLYFLCGRNRKVVVFLLVWDGGGIWRFTLVVVSGVPGVSSLPLLVGIHPLTA